MPDTAPPPPHGGELVDLRVDAARTAAAKDAARGWPSWTLTDLQTADLELLATGAYAPLTGFATADEHDAIVADERLPDGTPWPWPITLDVDAETGAAVSAGDALALRDGEGTMLAVLHVASRWEPDAAADARGLLGTDDPRHPEVAALLARTGAVRLGGEVEVLELPAHHDFADARHTPASLRAALAEHDAHPLVGVALRGVPSRPLLARLEAEAAARGGGILLLTLVGPTEPGDLDAHTRVRVARRAAGHLRTPAQLAALPLPARLGGARETVLRALVGQNLGVTHWLVGPDDAASHRPQAGLPASPEGAGQRRLGALADELAVMPIPVPRQVLTPQGPRDRDAVDLDDPPQPQSHQLRPLTDLTLAELHTTLERDESPPAGLFHDDIVDEVAQAWPPRRRRGLTIFLTGLSGSGKSTIAKVLRERLLEHGGRTVTLLDGDLVRRHLSSELGFSKGHRDLNVLRIGYVASEITKHGGIAICAPIAPYDAIRKANRDQIEATGGGYVLVHVATPLAVCEARDRKGLYAKARAGEITGFTGIDDPYEEPDDAALTLDTTHSEPEEAADEILAHLRREGWWPPRE